MKGGRDRAPDRLGNGVDLAEHVFGRDLLAQVAQEVLLARHAHEIRVFVAVAHVAQRVLVAQLLVAGLEVDFRVVFGRRPVDVVVAVVDVHVHAAERVDHVDEAGEVHVHDAVQLQRGKHLVLDRFRGQHHRPPHAAQPAADRVGGVDLLVRVVLPAGRGDVDLEVARYRQHRGLPLCGVEAHQQHRVAVRRVVAIEGVPGPLAPVRAEDQKGLRAAAVDRGDHALRHPDRPRENLRRDTAHRVQRHRGRGPAAQQRDRHAGNQEALPHAPPQRRRSLFIHGVCKGSSSRPCAAPNPAPPGGDAAAGKQRSDRPGARAPSGRLPSG